MAHGERPDALHDFLYKDSARIASYYAQLFAGALTSLERTDVEREGTERSLTGGLPSVAGGGLKTNQGSESSTKLILDPHDLTTTDVLSFLAGNGHLHGDVVGAPHGALVLMQGTVVFIDSSMVELAAVTLETLAKSGGPRKQTTAARLTAQSYGHVAAFIRSLPMPSAFLLRRDDGVQVVGTIKDDGMQEPISTYYFKHGTSGLAGVHLIGIKEVPSSAVTVPEGQLIGASLPAAQALSEMLFPPDAIRVTPIALFRTLLDLGSTDATPQP